MKTFQERLKQLIDEHPYAHRGILTVLYGEKNLDAVIAFANDEEIETKFFSTATWFNNVSNAKRTGFNVEEMEYRPKPKAQPKEDDLLRMQVEHQAAVLVSIVDRLNKLEGKPTTKKKVK